MKLDANLGLDAKKLKKITTVAGIVSIVIVGYYVTGLYRNLLQIRKLKEYDSKPLSDSEL